MKKRLDEAVNNISIMDVFVKKWMLDIPFINRWWKPLLEPTYAFKEFLKKQVEERKKAIENGTHLLDTEPRDYVDAFILKMKEEAMNGVMDTTFEWVI
ncbi:hypothetical protein OSTOST_23137 [Ostertagia ostertagi]